MPRCPFKDEAYRPVFTSVPKLGHTEIYRLQNQATLQQHLRWARSFVVEVLGRSIDAKTCIYQMDSEQPQYKQSISEVRSGVNVI